MKKSAKAFIAEIEQNVDAYFADRIDSKTFGARQRVIWDAIETSRDHEAKAKVLGTVRKHAAALEGLQDLVA